MNYKPMRFGCMGEGPNGIVSALCPVPSLGSGGAAPAHPGQGREWVLAIPGTPGPCWVPIALLCSILRHFGGGCCCLLGRDALGALLIPDAVLG